MDTFDIYFASLAGWLLHPGYNRPDTPHLTLEEIAIMAEHMMEIKNGIRLRSSDRRSSST